jgi:hypothetical protein
VGFVNADEATVSDDGFGGAQKLDVLTGAAGPEVEAGSGGGDVQISLAVVDDE